MHKWCLVSFHRKTVKRGVQAVTLSPSKRGMVILRQVQGDIHVHLSRQECGFPDENMLDTIFVCTQTPKELRYFNIV